MSFARKIWKLLVAIKDGLVLILLLGFFAMLHAALGLRGGGGTVRDGALLIALDGYVVEEASAPSPFSMLASAEAPVGEYQARDVERALRLAAADKRIKLVVLDLSRFLGGGMVHMQEIGAALDRVRQAGKPVLTYANVYADDAVLLAAHSTEAWIDPMGGAFVAGPGGSQPYFKGLIDRLGVTTHVYRAGTYKSFVEPYLLDRMSDAAREAEGGLAQALFASWKADVARARPKARIDEVTRDPVGWLRASGGDMAEAARRAGLVDRIGSRTAFESAVAQRVGRNDEAGARGPAYAYTALDPWLAANPAPSDGAQVAVLTVAGTLVDGDGGAGAAQGERLARLLDRALDEGKAKALVLRVDSPGGSTMASERVRLAVMRWREKKLPVVVSMGNVAASGGYWIATAGQKIYARPATVTGSIGVFAVLASFENTLARYGVTSDGVRTTPLSGQPDLISGFTPEVSALFQTSIEQTYARFVGLVAAARGRSGAQIETAAEGRAWDGRSARRLGLVDGYGGLDAATAEAARMAGLGDQWHPVFLAEQPDTLASLLFGGGQASARAQGGAPYDFAGFVARRRDAQLARAIGAVDGLVRGQSVQALCLACPPLPAAPVPVEQAAPGWLRWLAAPAGR